MTTPEQTTTDPLVERVLMAVDKAASEAWKGGDHGFYKDEREAVRTAITEALAQRYEEGRAAGRRWLLCAPCAEAWAGHEDEIEKLTSRCAACGSSRTAGETQ